MSRNNQQNRAARKRKQQRRDQRQSGRGRSGGGAGNWLSEVEELVYAGIDYAARGSSHAAYLSNVVAELTERDTHPDRAIADARLSEMFDLTLDGLFANGWQPAEAVHCVRREFDARATRLVTTAVGYHASRTSAHTTAPAQWREQLEEMKLPAFLPTQAMVTHWRQSEGGDPAKAWTAILQVLGHCGRLPRMEPLIPVPSKWGRASARPSGRSGADPRVLARIRGLLAKAESTTFAAEAESLSAKAQDLMTRYALDSAVVDADDGASLVDEVRTRRLLIDNPYPEAKMQLLNSVANANGIQALWHGGLGLASCVGLPVDLDLCELLYTSLLVQASNAMAEAGGGQRLNRAPSFRRSFLIGFAHRIGERLLEAKEGASREAEVQYGTQLVPIMAARAEAVGEVFERQFPEVGQTSTAVTNGAGWRAGQVAAELADLTGHRERISERI
ncbi:DUF2786 domain-containing protein [Tomitella biformata]|uniref:DUF2786 domain-containing protein n=1 Tax=Tomitella biformata TaxID=630403 RepID=UPI00046609BA|nr:DUF2786 domain-containing protein [Tomitella biformata]